MKAVSVGASLVGGIITFIVTCISAAVFFFMLMIDLNGFIGQQRAVNTSFDVYLVLAALIILLVTVVSAVLVGYLPKRFEWNALLTVLLSSVSFSVAACVMHFSCAIIAAVVADTMRTGR